MIHDVALHRWKHCTLCLWINWMSHWVVEMKEFRDVVWVYVLLELWLDVVCWQLLTVCMHVVVVMLYVDSCWRYACMWSWCCWNCGWMLYVDSCWRYACMWSWWCCMLTVVDGMHACGRGVVGIVAGCCMLTVVDGMHACGRGDVVCWQLLTVCMHVVVVCGSKRFAWIVIGAVCFVSQDLSL